MGTPQDVNKGLDLFRTLIFDNVVEAAIVEFEGSLISIPVAGEVIKEVEMKFADLLYEKLQGQVVLSTVLFVDVAHRKAFAEAEVGLKGIALEKGIDSPEFKEAHEKEKQALKKFGQFNVVQPGLTGK